MEDYDIQRCDPNKTYGGPVILCADNNAVFDHYLNECVYATLIQFTDQEMEPSMQFIYGYLLPALALVVIATNGVVIWVLNEQKTKRATIDPLLYMAISALLMCLSPLPFTIYYYTLGHFRDFNESIVVCYLHKEKFSEWFWVARCFIGHSSIARKIGAEKFSSIFDIFRLMLIVIPSVLLFAITFFLITTIRTSESPHKLGVHRHKMRKASANTTTMLTVIIVLFLLARLPSATLIILSKLEHLLNLEHLQLLKDSHLLVACSNLAMMSLHPLSFAVYIFMSRRFRISLRRLLGLRFLASDEDFNAFTSSSHPSIRSGSRKPFPLEQFKKESNSHNYTSARTSRSSLSDHRKSSVRKVVVMSPLLDSKSRSPRNPRLPPRRCDSTPMQTIDGNCNWKNIEIDLPSD
ncbi:hypothetical protein WR25_02880 [Diploscapter pachys]|uniref:G-protein coupled receptors family 1 profile domain-containing protein n=1 Tax=Diploscapter pachys TaxID=2018661 RepID=A0A2A2LF06_9BILA|nr:hypothetical protein WR25_02880 [Diploscapter pachys]